MIYWIKICSAGTDMIRTFKKLYKMGISLIELLVVVAILTVVLYYAASNSNDIPDSARLAKAKKDLDTIKGAIRFYHIDTNGKYPASMDVLVGKYLPYPPADSWGVPYQLDTANYEVFCIHRTTGQRLSIKYGQKK